jgi:EAL domain-containing protein (putative c-di-GMP-specific phosphodiesterase class I)
MHDRTLYATKERGRNAIGRLKIDRKFIRDVADGRDSASLVEGIMAMPRSLHLDCIAEGVESVGQVAYLWKLGCFQVQGYYFGRPMASKALLEHLQEQEFSAEPSLSAFGG